MVLHPFQKPHCREFTQRGEIFNNDDWNFFRRRIERIQQRLLQGRQRRFRIGSETAQCLGRGSLNLLVFVFQGRGQIADRSVVRSFLIEHLTAHAWRGFT